MRTPTGRAPPLAAAGFTLVELLLAVVLLLLLLSAVVFSFSALQSRAPLEEGATQLEALLRFARAQAANTGRQVQIAFEEDVGDGLFLPLGNLRALWEPDPLGAPGLFLDLPEAAPLVRGITDLVSIEEVRPIDAGEDELLRTALSEDAGPPGEAGGPVSPAALTFYPDGSSGSLEIVLASRDKEDPRRLAVRLEGIVGSVQRQWVAPELGPAEASWQNETSAHAVAEPK